MSCLPARHLRLVELDAEPAPPPPALELVPGCLPAVPPPELLDEIDAAADRAAELAADDRELHFELDEATGRIVVLVRDLDGTVLRTLSPSEALDVMTGLDL